jgi:hypothetical protein
MKEQNFTTKPLSFHYLSSFGIHAFIAPSVGGAVDVSVPDLSRVGEIAGSYNFHYSISSIILKYLNTVSFP